MKQDITNLFAFIDDFSASVDLYISHHFISQNQKLNNPTRIPTMTISEILTIALLYHKSPCKNFKYFYQSYLQLYKPEFPNLVSYERFISLKPRILGYLQMLLQWLISLSHKTGISFIDATAIAICHNKRISKNKVFKEFAALGKTTMGFFYGFKLHLIISDKGEIHGAKLTKGNVDDRVPVPALAKNLTGLLFGDKGYIKAKLFSQLYAKDLKLVTGIKKGMKNKPMIMFEKQMLRKRSIIETVFDYLKNKFELEHSRHRSVWNFLVHIMSTLVVYSMKTTKPKVTYNNCVAAT